MKPKSKIWQTVYAWAISAVKKLRRSHKPPVFGGHKILGAGVTWTFCDDPAKEMKRRWDKL